MTVSSCENFSEKNNSRNGTSVRKIIILLALSVAVIFLMARPTIADGSAPFVIGILAILVSNNRLCSYFLPVCVASGLTLAASGYPVWGDLAAELICTILFLIIKSGRLNIIQRSLVVSGIMIICNGVYFYAGHIFYRFDPVLMAGKVLLIIAVCIGTEYALTCFGRCSRVRTKFDDELFIKNINLGNNRSQCGCAVWTGFVVVAAGGTGIHVIVLGTALAVAMCFGYSGGTSSGLLSGLVAGIAIAVMGTADLDFTVVILLGGVAAALTSSLPGIVTACCAVAAAMAGIAAIGELTNQVFLVATSAAGLMMCILSPDLNKLSEAVFCKRTAASTSSDDKIHTMAVNYARMFRAFDSMYTAGYGTDNVASYQFRASADIFESIAVRLHDTSWKSRDNAHLPIKFKLIEGSADYASIDGICGDSHAYSNMEDGRSIAILSDGMGRGGSAAKISRMAVKIVSRYIASGVEPELALKVVNSIMLSGGIEEAIATMDMAIIDRRTGIMKLYKTGAAATFIKRKERVSAIVMDALPLGVVRGVTIDFTRVKLKDGDIIILVTDGVTDCVRGDVQYSWLKDEIRNIQSEDPDTISNIISAKARAKYETKEKDDITVMAVRVTV